MRKAKRQSREALELQVKYLTAALSAAMERNEALAAREEAEERYYPPVPPGIFPDSIIPPSPIFHVQIVGGGPPTARFPDCAAVAAGALGFGCSGVLIAPDLVVSAKHCRNNVTLTHVYLKGSDYTNLPNANNEVIPIQQVIPCPLDGGKYDLLLLRLRDPSSVTPRRIVRLAEFAPRLPGRGTIAGFGSVLLTGARGNTAKHEAMVPIQIQTNSIEFLGGHRGLLRDTCRGDSGGPLYVTTPGGEDALLGITLRGVVNNGTCGDGGVYLRLEPFLPWIQQATGLSL